MLRIMSTRHLLQSMVTLPAAVTYIGVVEVYS
jgi:hypothetical protein